LLAAQDVKEGLGDEDAIPDVPQAPVRLPGDLWHLGSHRLLCGDATVEADRERLMGDQRADLGVTDPPYNVDYEGYTEDRLTIQGDRIARSSSQFLAGAFNAHRAIPQPGARYAATLQLATGRPRCVEQAGFASAARLIWAKNHFAWGFGPANTNTSPALPPSASQQDRWYGISLSPHCGREQAVANLPIPRPSPWN
jgi:hypothetical protein